MWILIWASKPKPSILSFYCLTIVCSIKAKRDRKNLKTEPFWQNQYFIQGLTSRVQQQPSHVHCFRWTDFFFSPSLEENAGIQGWMSAMHGFPPPQVKARKRTRRAQHSIKPSRKTLGTELNKFIQTSNRLPLDIVTSCLYKVVGSDENTTAETESTLPVTVTFHDVRHNLISHQMSVLSYLDEKVQFVAMARGTWGEKEPHSSPVSAFTWTWIIEMG